MEDTLREYNEETYSKKKLVLILVLMEDTLRGKVIFVSLFSISLNPCFNGRYSQSKISCSYSYVSCVLILVLMEDTLRERNNI